MSYSIIKNANKPTVAVALAPTKHIAKPIKQYINHDYTLSIVREDSIQYNSK